MLQDVDDARLAILSTVRVARALASRGVEAARRSASPRAFRDAVALLCELQPSYGRDVRTLALLHEALSATGDDQPAARAQLLSLRGLMAYVDADLSAHETASREALRLARASGDPAARLEAMRVCCFGLNHPASEREWGALCDERIDLALAAGDVLHEFQARQQRFELSLQRGDVSDIAEELRALEAIGARVSSPKLEAALLGIRAGLAIASGPIAEARRLSESAFAIGRRIDHGEWWAIAQLQTSALLGFEDRGTDAFRGVHRGTQSHAQVSLFRAGEIWLHCLAGRESEARRALLEVAKDHFAAIQRDVSYPLTISNLALSCAHLRCAEVAEDLYALLLPYAGRNLTMLCWYSCGCASRFLGLVAGSLARFGDAAEHFETALRVNRACGARVWEAHTALDYARVLLAHGGARRVDRARDLARAARETSRELGIAYVERLAGELTAAAR